MSDLRASLAVSTPTGIPTYRMLLPAGWRSYDLSVETEASLVEAAVTRLASAGRPDVGSALAAQVRESVDTLRAQHAFVYALPTEGAPTWVLGGASLVGLRRTASPQVTLDDIVEDAVRNRGGIPVGEGHRMVRWVDRRRTTVDGVAAMSLLINYLIPIPGTRRTQAVQWTASVAYDAAMDQEDPVLVAWIALFDNHISSFTWSVR
jgi:hypothetical protein